MIYHNEKSLCKETLKTFTFINFIKNLKNLIMMSKHARVLKLELDDLQKKTISFLSLIKILRQKKVL